MNNVIVALGFIFITSFSLAQDDNSSVEPHKFRFGFNVGINLTNVYTEGAPDQTWIQGGPGFRLGVLADFQFSRLISLSPRAELSFNAASVHFPNSDPSNSISPYRIMQNSLEFAPLVKFRLRDKKLMPYFIAGPNLKIPIRHNQGNSSTTVYSNSPDIAFDVGFGIEKGFGRVFSSLEIKYSLGMVNINQHPMMQSAKLHNISLVWNFTG